jgi:hypothetical protein
MRNLSVWVQFVLFILMAMGLQAIWHDALEYVIVIAFLYDIGFELRFVDELILMQKKVHHWLHHKLDTKRKRRKNINSNEQSPN